MEDIIEQAVFQDLYLKADDEASLMAALADAGIYFDQDEITETDEEGNVIVVQPEVKGLVSGVSLDIIGTIYKPTGAVDEDGNEQMVAIDGFHANLRGAFTEEQKAKLPLIDAPATPMRVWA